MLRNWEHRSEHRCLNMEWRGRIHETIDTTKLGNRRRVRHANIMPGSAVGRSRPAAGSLKRFRSLISRYGRRADSRGL